MRHLIRTIHYKRLVTGEWELVMNVRNERACTVVADFNYHCCRHASTSTYSHTICLPKTTFAINVKPAQRIDIDQKYIERIGQLYEWQLNDASRQHLPVYVARACSV
jgi:hypothetical protein